MSVSTTAAFLVSSICSVTTLLYWVLSHSKTGICDSALPVIMERSTIVSGWQSLKAETACSR